MMLLFFGISFAQEQFDVKEDPNTPTIDQDSLSAPIYAGSFAAMVAAIQEKLYGCMKWSPQLMIIGGVKQSQHLLGMKIVIAMCLLSGVSSVYVEKVLRPEKKYLWVRNTQLALSGVVVGLLLFIKDFGIVWEHGIFIGFDKVVFFIVLLNSFGGLLVSIIVGYVNEVIRTFSTSLTILLSTLADLAVFGLIMTPQFGIGVFLVILAVNIYDIADLKFLCG